MTSALGVSAMVFNVGRMVGPAIAGAGARLRLGGLVLRAQRGQLRRHHRRAAGHAPAARAAACRRRRGAAQGFAASLSVLFAFPAVRYLLPTVVAIGLFATPYVPLMPSIVAHFFDGQSSTVGLLMSAAAVGALFAAGYLSLQPRYGRQLRLMTLAPLAVGVALGAVRLVAHAAAVGAAAGGARRRPRCSASTPPTPCCSSRCPTSGAAA